MVLEKKSTFYSCDYIDIAFSLQLWRKNQEMLNSLTDFHPDDSAVDLLLGDRKYTLEMGFAIWQRPSPSHPKVMRFTSNVRTRRAALRA